jgi:superfamily II DNA helicase RecQ
MPNQKEPAFRLNEQKEAVFVVIGQQSLLIVILLIKGGKTLTFILPAVLQKLRVTIVMALFNALKKDYIQRLRLSYIEYMVWRYREARYTPVVVVSTDQAVLTGFIIYILMLWKRKLLC